MIYFAVILHPVGNVREQLSWLRCIPLYRTLGLILRCWHKQICEKQNHCLHFHKRPTTLNEILRYFCYFFWNNKRNFRTKTDNLLNFLFRLQKFKWPRITITFGILQTIECALRLTTVASEKNDAIFPRLFLENDSAPSTWKWKDAWFCQHRGTLLFHVLVTRFLSVFEALHVVWCVKRWRYVLGLPMQWVTPRQPW